MRVSIRSKLIVTYLFISVFTALLIYILTNYTSEPRINSLALEYQTAEITKEAQYWYAEKQTWDGFATFFKTLHPPPEIIAKERPLYQPKLHMLLDVDKRALLKYRNYLPGEVIPDFHLVDAQPLMYQSKTIGWVVPPDSVGISLKSQMMIFFENVNEILMIAVAIAIICSLIMGVILAKIVLKPVESITKASVDIASGKLAQQVTRYTNDEIGDLSLAFNKMSHDLVKADTQRKQLTADITHDLASPIQVISGYIEMAQEEGKLSAERIGIIADELEQVNRLLQDMNLLAKTDSNTLSLKLYPVQVRELLGHIVRLYQKSCNDKNVQISIHYKEGIAPVLMDEMRIIQVLSNLVTNALRYTPEGGSIVLSAKQVAEKLEIVVTDTGSGIHAEDLPYIFDRFYRGSTSRSEASGKMGLGLAISQGLVKMHGGEIYAYAKQQGASFKIILPIE